jgi:predicted RNA binding protein YcfA (HicA-like mRNA interferase family)
MKHPDGRVMVVPVHHNEELDTGLLRQIAQGVKISREKFLPLLDEV